MNLRDLEYVTAIDRYRNFGRAADACHVSQPSLSAQVKKLEARLGVDLFVRSSSGVVTTNAGMRIVATAKEVLRHAQRITDTAAEYHDPLAAPLRIGIIPTLAPFFLPYLDTCIASVADDLKAMYREFPTEVLLAELDNRTIDVALLSGPTDLSGFNFTPIFREPFTLMVADGHRVSNQNSIAADAIPHEEMFLLTKEHCLHNETTRLCTDKNIGVDVPAEMHASNLLTLAHFLKPEIGCALVPALANDIISKSNPRMHFIQIEDEAFGRDIGFVSRKECPRDHILQALCRIIRAAAPEGVTALD